MKVIKIDVEKQEVYPIDLPKGIDALYVAIGNHCRCVDRVTIHDTQDDIWLHDEGLFLEPQPHKFRFAGIDQPLTGNAIVCGYTSAGSSTDVNITLEEVRDRVEFIGDVYVAPVAFVFSF